MKKTILYFTMSLIFSSIFITTNIYGATVLTSENTLYCAMRKNKNNSDSSYRQNLVIKGSTKDIDTINENNNNQSKLVQSNRTQRFFTGFIILVLLLVLIFIFIIMRSRSKKRGSTYQYRNARLNNYNDDLIRELKYKVRALESKINGNNHDISVLERKVRKVESILLELQESNEASLKENVIDETTTLNEVNDVNNTSKPEDKIKYLKGKSGNKFTRLVDYKDDETFYCLEKKDSIGTFQFCGNLKNALYNLSAVFDYVCDYEGIPEDATEIVNLEPGQVELKDGNWTVTKKAKIMFK